MKYTPFCYACECIETQDGWKNAEKSKISGEIYETLCQECLVKITDTLIKDVAA